MTHRRRKPARRAPEPSRKLVRALLNSLEDTAETLAVVRTLLLLKLRERRTDERLRLIQSHLKRLVPFDRFTVLRLAARGRCEVLHAFEGRRRVDAATAAWPGRYDELKDGRVRIRKRIPLHALPLRPTKPVASSHVADATIPLVADDRGAIVLHLACYEPDRILPEHRDILDQLQPALAVVLHES